MNDLKARIQAKHNEVISFNEQLKENQIRQTQEQINSLSNQVAGLQSKLENLQHTQENSAKRISELEDQKQH